MKKLILLALLLTGCASNQVKEPQIHHVAYPDPIVDFNKQWEVKVINDAPYVGMKYDDFLDFETWLIDVKRYIKDQNNMICYYRTDLHEEKCK